jgi:hypothetical protein
MLLAATTGDWGRFERHAGEALARNAAMGTRTWLASTQVDLADVLTKRGFEGDADRASDLLTASVQACEELGMPALATRAEAVRRRGAAQPDMRTSDTR